MPYFNYQGACLRYALEGAGRQPLVLYHGLSGSLNDWYTYGYVAALQAEYRLLLLETQDQSGQAPCPQTSAAPPPLQSDMLAAVLDHLHIGRTYLFGYGLGGTIVGNIAQAIPERVRALIIGGAVPDPGLRTVLAERAIPCFLPVGEHDPVHVHVLAWASQTTQATYATVPRLGHAQAFQQAAGFLPGLQAFLAQVWQRECDVLMRQMSKLITAIAGRLGGQVSDQEEWIQIGWEVLLGEIIWRYDPRKSALSTYAALRIRGAMIDYIRRYGAPVYVRRLSGVQKQQLDDLTRLRQQWYAEHGRAPTGAELADHLGMAPDRVDELTVLAQARAVQAVPTDTAIEARQVRDRRHARATPEEDAEAAELAALAQHGVAPCLAQLPPELHTLVRLRMQGLSLRAVGMALGISHPQTVSEKEQAAHHRLRACFEQWIAGHRVGR